MLGLCVAHRAGAARFAFYGKAAKRGKHWVRVGWTSARRLGIARFAFYEKAAKRDKYWVCASPTGQVLPASRSMEKPPSEVNTGFVRRPPGRCCPLRVLWKSRQATSLLGSSSGKNSLPPFTGEGVAQRRKEGYSHQAASILNPQANRPRPTPEKTTIPPSLTPPENPP